jgi:hypothetical protein
MDTQLSQGLTFLAWTGGGFLIVVGIFVVKLLFDLSRLTQSLNRSADIVQGGLEPIMKNLGETATTINTLVQTTNTKVGKVTEAYDRASQIVIKAVSKASAVSGVVLKEVAKGLFAGFKMIVSKK